MSGRRILVLGSGGREHALALALARAPSVAEVLVAPGNSGMDAPSGGAPIRSLPDASLGVAHVVELARKHRVDLVVVGPERPLCDGVVDALEQAGIAAFGPCRAASRLEGSKAFLKQFAERAGIATAPYFVTDRFDDAVRYLDEHPSALVVKADGLASGKGTVVTRTVDEAKAAAYAMLVERAFGDAGARIVLEERLFGQELSVHAVTDGENLLVLPLARDHKRLGDGDTGPNTGGMGACAPLEIEPDLAKRIERDILHPTLAALRAQGTPFRGVLFAGVIVTPSGTPYLLEHNVRFGDPEAQVLLPLLDGDVAELFASVAAGRLDASAIRVAEDRYSVAVVLAAEGYPGAPSRESAIVGIEAASALDQVHVVHAGTANRSGTVTASAGRVLGVVGVSTTRAAARRAAYEASSRIRFEGLVLRRDIAAAWAEPPLPADTRRATAKTSLER
jgi:phosphoribosylamine--glycine ligase